ncbi:MAG: glycosyltransferase family 4 protein, partial [Acidimicrobiia bacterium]
AQRFEVEKRTDVAIRAWAASRLRRDGWQLTLAGTGSQSVELDQLAHDLGVEASIDFIGRQTDMTTLLSRAAIFLATTPAESFGLSVVEAMAAGVPVIAARGGGHLETIGAMSDRCLFPIGDWQTAATMLDSLGSDPSERDRVGMAVRAWQREHLSIESHVDQLEQIYAELQP